jgi:CheY-like chemotaxis protein
MAWLWLASISDSDEEKTSHLQKVLNIDPENRMAQTSLQSIKKQMAEANLQKAFRAAAAGANELALEALQEVFKKSPEMEDAWVLKSFLVESLGEKLGCFEKVLEFNSDHQLAQAGVVFLRSMLDKRETPQTGEAITALEDAMPALDDEMPALEDATPALEDATPAFEEMMPVEDVSATEADAADLEDKSPTEELEYPAAAVDNFSADDFDEAPSAEFEESAERIDPLEMEEIEFADAPAEIDDEIDAETGFYEEFENQETEASFAAEEMSMEPELAAEEPEAAFAEPETEPELKSEIEAEDVSGAEEIAQTYAFEKAESLDELAPAEAFDEDIHETEAAAYDFEEEEPEHEAFAADADEDVYEIEIDELYANKADAVEEISFEDDPEFAAGPSAEIEEIAAEASVQPSSMSMTACPFCDDENEPQAFSCRSCCAVLTLSDLEMLLAAQEAHKDIVGDAVHRLEKSKIRRDLEADELKTIAIGYFNMKNPKKGVLYLNEAARLNPDDILLSSQVNALKIRLAEIEKQESIHNSMPKNRQILVVDDSATVRKLISGKLEKCGHEVICAVDGVDALEKLKEISPDLILLDINMPRMDGYQVCKMIRGNETMKDTPVVMISGKDGFFDKVRGRMAGTTGYITKPFGPETLMKTVETYIVQPV